MTDLRQAAQMALEALEDSHQNINPERGFAEELEKQIDDAIEALREALAQQGEQQPDVLAEYTRTDGRRQWESVGAWLLPGEQIAVISAAAAPAAQQGEPTCKQDLQVPTVKENLTVETAQERYVRMCPDIECGRKKKCTRMVGVSCMSRADIAPAAKGCDYCNNPMFIGRSCKNCGREFAGAAQAAQPKVATEGGNHLPPTPAAQHGGEQ